MATGILPLHNLKVGEVFTPIQWACWLVNQWNVFDRWIDGATVCDPTAGEGRFAFALFQQARERGIAVTKEMLSRLCLMEWKQSYLDKFLHITKREYDLTIPAASICRCDIILDTPRRSFDILVGNPPWMNFTDLPPDYKETIKPYFCQAGLVPNRKGVLLGSSRTDIAALVLKIALGQLLREQGTAHFFVPLSLFAGDDAHIGFRNYQAFESVFSVLEVFEFNKTKVFEGVKTSYCCASIKKGRAQTFPVRYFREGKDGWEKYKAQPLNLPSDPWRIIAPNERLKTAIGVRLSPRQKPRQGVNTCGANNVFLFDDYPNFLDERYIFPLATKDLWRNSDRIPRKWIFLPYDINSGRPLRSVAIRELRGYDYLETNKKRLIERKGTLINSLISKGFWWSLLGVGPYSFAPYKVIWQAYGRSEFYPILLSNYQGKNWQGNQAMHAFIPCWDLPEAKRIMNELRRSNISVLLKQLNGIGKCNWAQPGKIRKILSLNCDQVD